jgi:hypothetical protein
LFIVKENIPLLKVKSLHEHTEKLGGNVLEVYRSSKSTTDILDVMNSTLTEKIWTEISESKFVGF